MPPGCDNGDLAGWTDGRPTRVPAEGGVRPTSRTSSSGYWGSGRAWEAERWWGIGRVLLRPYLVLASCPPLSPAERCSLSPLLLPAGRCLFLPAPALCRRTGEVFVGPVTPVTIRNGFPALSVDVLSSPSVYSIEIYGNRQRLAHSLPSLHGRPQVPRETVFPRRRS